jgi:hypothetical protein
MYVYPEGREKLALSLPGTSIRFWPAWRRIGFGSFPSASRTSTIT